MSKQKIINFIAGPGAGKTTFMAGTFFGLKRLGINCEQTPEETKKHEWEGRTGKVRESQDYIFAKQHFACRRLEGEVDFIVTDSPVILTLAYSNKEYLPSLDQVAIEAFNRFENFNFFVHRNSEEYLQKGRGQTLDQSKGLDIKLINILYAQNAPFIDVFKDDIDNDLAKILKFVQTHESMTFDNRNDFDK